MNQIYDKKIADLMSSLDRTQLLSVISGLTTQSPEIRMEFEQLLDSHTHDIGFHPEVTLTNIRDVQRFLNDLSKRKYKLLKTRFLSHPARANCKSYKAESKKGEILILDPSDLIQNLAKVLNFCGSISYSEGLDLLDKLMNTKFVIESLEPSNKTDPLLSFAQLCAVLNLDDFLSQACILKTWLLYMSSGKLFRDYTRQLMAQRPTVFRVLRNPLPFFPASNTAAFQSYLVALYEIVCKNYMVGNILAWATARLLSRASLIQLHSSGIASFFRTNEDLQKAYYTSRRR